MKKELKIGIFAIAVIVLSFFVLNYLRGKDIFDREAEYVATYHNAEGLVASAPVYVKGYKAGKVSQVVYDGATDAFRVVCAVSRQFSIPEDSKMTIYSVDIMGGKGIRIDLGTSGVMAEDGDTLASGFEAGLIDGLAAGIGPVIGKVGTTLDSLEVAVSGVNRLLSEAGTASVRRTLSHVESITADLRSLSSEINGKSAEITSLIENLKMFSDALDGFAQKADSALGGLDTVVASLDSADLAGTVNSLKNLLDSINDPDGTVGKLLADDAIYDSVDSLLLNVDRFIDKIQENPKKYLKISVF